MKRQRVVTAEELRYVRVLHMGFDDQTHIGELVCHKDLARDRHQSAV